MASAVPPPSRAQIISLFRSLLRTARQFSDYNIREYAKRRAVDAFRHNRKLSDPSSVSAAFSDGSSQLQVAKRQALVCSLYTPKADDSLTGTEVGSVMCPSYGNYNLDSQYLNTNVIDTAKLSNAVPSFRCEVCHIVCTGQDAFDKHNQGKKHRRNLQLQACSIHNVAVGTSSASVTGELEKKQQTLLQNGTPAGSVLFCTICNIACNDEAVFQTHLIGKKHAKQVAKQSSAVAGPASAHCDLCQISCNSPQLFKMHLSGKRHLKNLEKSEKTVNVEAATENPEDKEGKGESLQEIESKENPKDIKVKGENLQETENKVEADVKKKGPENTPSTRCEVCNITCTSPQLLNTHLEGKRHKKNLLKAETESFIGPLVGPVSQIIGPTSNPDGVEGRFVEIQTPAKRSRGSNEDVETKRQKIMRGGGAPDLVRVCRICNVVCSSPTVYISHLFCLKHLAVAKKATEAGIP